MECRFVIFLSFLLGLLWDHRLTKKLNKDKKLDLLKFFRTRIALKSSFNLSIWVMPIFAVYFNVEIGMKNLFEATISAI